MINPTPLHTRSTPYAPGSGKSPLPRIMAPEPNPRRRKIRRFFAYLIIILIAAIGTYAFAQYYSFTRSIAVNHQGSSSTILANNGNADIGSLKQAGDGRFNLLLLGVGGAGHDGAYLTDTIKVLSLDTVNKKLTITSVPRDLYVSVPGYSKSKINAAFPDAAGINGQDPAAGGALAKKVVGNVLGTTISNFAMVDFSAAKDLVNSLGGIDVTVPTTLSDPLFPCPDPSTAYCPFYIAAGQHHMDGTTALNYSRSRETTSDFDRAARQTIVLKAIKDKALTAGVLANPIKVSNLVSILGNHVKTDMSTSDMLTFINLIKDIPSDQIVNYVLSTDPDQGLLTSITDPTAGYIEYPVLGMSNFSAIQEWYQKNDQDPFLLKETPTVSVIGDGTATQAQLAKVVTALNAYGYQAALGTQTAPSYATTTVFDSTKSKKPVSHAYLGSYFGVTVKGTSPISTGSDFTVVYVP